MKKAAIIQARMGSNRLPGKVLLNLYGKSVLQRIIERIRQSNVDDIIVATTINIEDDAIINLCKELKCNYARGSEEDVLSRVLNAAKEFKVDIIVEITADCPLIDPVHINKLLVMHDRGQVADITSNIIKRTFPRGYDIRVFNARTLERVNKEVDNPIDRQHVATWMYLNPKGKKGYTSLNLSAAKGENRPDLEVTLDTSQDYELIKWIFGAGKDYRLTLSCNEVVELLTIYPAMCKDVAKIERKDYYLELQSHYDSKNKK